MPADDTTQAWGNDSPRYDAHGPGALGRLGESPEHSRLRWPFWLVALTAGLTLGACSGAGQAPAAPVSATPVSATPVHATPGSAMPTANLLLRPVFETPFTFKDAMGDVMNVSLIGVMYGPQGTADISPGIAYRWVGAEFKIVGISGTSSGAPNADISLIPVLSDTETYRPDPSGVMAGCPGFRGGYTVTAGQTSIGCVIFRGPWDDRWQRIEWRAGSGATPVSWYVPEP
jgi:hypothetical protein